MKIRHSLVVLAMVTLGIVSVQPACAQSAENGPTDKGTAEKGTAEKGPTDKEPSDNKAGPEPTQLLRNATDRLGKLRTGSYRMTMNYQMDSAGMNYNMVTKTSIRFRRPNHLAFHVDEGIMGITVVCDGDRITRYLPSLNRYSVEEAPEDLSSLDGEDGMMMLGGTAGLFDFSGFAGGNRLYQQLMEGVKEAKYLGQQKVDGIQCHHCRFMQDDMDWDLWIEAGERSLIRKLEMDMRKQFEEAGDEIGELFKDAKMTMAFTFDRWNTSPIFADEDFQFTPPEGAEKVDSLFDDLEITEQAESHPLLGQPAPSFKTVDLQQKNLELQEHLGKDVVILDFWATWCGPCVRALPEIARVAEAFADKGVVFYAVNVGEEVEDISRFLESEKLDIPVALDSKGEISERYQANAIPQTVLIGKDGTVQVVHVGFTSGLEAQLTGELEALLAGEDLAAAALRAAPVPARENKENRAPFETEGVKPIWSTAGSWNSVVDDPSSEVLYALGNRGKVAVLDGEGTILREFMLERGGTALRPANLMGDDSIELVSFKPWGSAVRAHAADGSELWDYTLGQGVDDVWPADLNDDGLDEIIIGYNGATGLHVLDNRGILLWKYTAIGNVWHVCAGDFDGDGEANVLTTSARGQLHLFDAEGKSLANHELSLYATMVRTAQISQDSPGRVALLGGSGNEGEALVAVESSGRQLWRVALPGADHIDSLQVAPDRPWAAVGMRGGLVYLVELTGGRMMGHLVGQGRQPQVAWAHRTGLAPLLVVATGKSVHAAEVLVPADER